MGAKEDGRFVASDFSKYAPGGITLRQHLAGLAMQGLAYEAARWSSDKGFVDPNIVAMAAVNYADALIKELDRTAGHPKE